MNEGTSVRIGMGEVFRKSHTFGPSQQLCRDVAVSHHAHLNDIWIITTNLDHILEEVVEYDERHIATPIEAAALEVPISPSSCASFCMAEGLNPRGNVT